MSEKDFDWNDDLDFESLADEKEMAADYGEPEDSLSDFEDLSDYADSPEPASNDSGGLSTEESAAPVDQGLESERQDEEPSEAPSSSSELALGQQKAVSPAGLGFLVVACTMVGAVGMAGAFLLVSGMDPLSLWNPAGLMSLDKIMNFQGNPLNILYLVTLGVVVLTAIGASLAARQARKANAQIHHSERMLNRVTALRLDNELPWTNEEFKSDPETSAFVTDVLGAWRLQQARQVRSVGLEGEIRRLEKALRENSREDLADRYDHPLIGTLADAMVGWYDDRDAARKEADAVKDKDSLETAEIMSLIEDSRSWNQSNRQRVDVQKATLRRWSEKFKGLADKFEKESSQNGVVAGLQGLQSDLSRTLENGSIDSMASMDDLVDRGSKLAFQIAMEVARLGPRGERLLPMSQSLEELTTKFRQTVAKAKTSDQSDMANPQAVLTRLEQITVQLVKDGPGGAGGLARTMKDLVPASQKLADNLDDISSSFAQQGTRLNTLGTTFADLASMEFDPEKVLDNVSDTPPEGGLTVTQNDPFGKDQDTEESSFEVDPFGGSAAYTNEQSILSADPVVEQVVEPAEKPGDELVVESAVDFSGDPVSNPVLPAEEEKVYDLAEFGAVRIDQENDSPAFGKDEDRIYDLVEFGAVALN